MKVSIFGLGYVGCVTAGCLARKGHEVIGVDINPAKVATINAGESPIAERGLPEIVRDARARGLLSATTDPAEAVRRSDASLVCVGTPGGRNGSIDLKMVKTVTRQIGEALRGRSTYHCVVFRSTMLPGTVRTELIPILSETSGRAAHDGFGVCFNPEFLREGSSVADFDQPPMTIIGQETSAAGDVVAGLYEGVGGPFIRTSYEAAEMVKYACNAFHALKVTFANEIGILCKEQGIDGHQLMDLFMMDRKLNISPAYLKPGFAFGGSCLPKDLRALLHRAKELDARLPVLESVLESNRLQLQRAVDWILGTKLKRVGVFGLSFKAGTDDLRESPIVALVETLIGKGCELRIYDPDVLLANVTGTNKEFIEREIPHISSLMCAEPDEVLQASEIVVLCKPLPWFTEKMSAGLGDKVVLDLVRVMRDGARVSGSYEGICW